jgi:transposase
MTRRLRRYIVRQGILPEESFNGIAERVGRSARNIRDIFEKHRAHLVKIREIQTPRVMGIDGVYVKGQESLIVTDIERKRPVMLRPFIKERPVADAMREMPNLNKVEEVLADMSGSLDRVQQVVIPKAIRTKDRYHVQRMANAAVDFVRKEITPGRRDRKKGQMSMCRSHILRKRKKQLKPADLAALEWCLGLYRELRLTYELKEVYCEFWNSPDETTARRKYAEWLKLHKAWRKEMPKDLRKAFDPLLRIMKNWDEGIFNYFSNRHTNAYTESANAQVKKLVNKAPRLKFDNVNTKIVHGSRLKQQRKANRERGKVRRQQAQPAQPMPSPPMASAGVVTEPPQTNEPLTPLSTSGSIAADVKQQGPRLDADRIASLKWRSGGADESASPLSPQMSLFE